MRSFFTMLCGAVLFASAALAQEQVPLEDVVRDAALRSTLASPGAAPFHLQAKISDEKEHDPQLYADVEEWWESPTRWRREFHSRSFSQILIVNGEKVQEQDSGPVFPELLRNLTVELVDTVPRFDQLVALHQTVLKPDGKPGQIKATWTIPGTDGTTSRRSLLPSRSPGRPA